MLAAVSILDDGAASNGRLVLARAKVSVWFRPGGEGGTTSSMAVRLATPYHVPDSVPLRNAAALLQYGWSPFPPQQARGRFQSSPLILNGVT